MCPYSGTAPLKAGDGVKRKAYRSTLSIIWDGQAVGLTCYKINGKYYVNLDEIGYLTDSEVVPGSAGGWTASSKKPSRVQTPSRSQKESARSI